MSTAYPYPLRPQPAPLGRRVVESARRTLALDALSPWGLLAFVTGLSVGLSGVRQARFEVMGLYVQPYLLFVVAALPYLLVTRLQRIPGRILGCLLVFWAIFVVANFGTPIFLKESIKLTMSVAAIVACALMIERRADFVAGVFGLALAMAATGFRGLGVDDATSEATIEALGGIGNKNAYSIYAIPTLLLAGFVVLKMSAGMGLRAIKLVLIGSIMVMLLTIFSSGNRSGYLGAALVGVALFWNRKVIGLLLVTILAAGVSYWLVHTGGVQRLTEKWHDTFTSPDATNVARSDDIRRTLIINCIKLGMANPVLGMTPYEAQFEIVRGTKVEEYGAADPHNVFAYITAGCGFVCLAMMIGFGVTMSRWSGPDRPLLRANPDGRAMLWLLRWLAISWAVRGLFATDVLYIPSVCLGFGWAMGLASTEVRRMKEKLLLAKRPPLPRLAPAVLWAR